MMSDHVDGFSVLQVAGVGASGLADPGDIQILTNDATQVSLHGIAFYIDGK
jgi:hypothetical protein